jgi:subtilisin family serine protease
MAAGEGLYFHHLGAGLVHADTDQLKALHAHTDGEFVAIEPERIVRAGQLPSATPIQGETQHTWGLQATGVAHSRFSGRGVRVAILDSGLDLQHPDFAWRPIVSQSFVAGQSVDDTNGHGTYCAGLACGPSSPAQPPRYGVAGDAELYIGKVVGDDGNGADGNILAGIDWAVRSACAVVSLSVGTPVATGEPYSAIYEQAARRALVAGTLIMAAAGNASLRPDCIAPVDRPANCPSILAVAAIDACLQIAPFSCGGINPDGGEVNVAAPGVAIR